jgi:two-component system chemotaxis sensor kinase CheA
MAASNVLDQFKDTYITECLELLAQMEEELLELDESANSEKLNAIFRCAHSIKGGAGAFGFMQIAQFTHILEALLDKLRDGELAVSRELTDLLLKSRDVVLQMVFAARDSLTLDEDFGAEIAVQLRAVVEHEVVVQSMVAESRVVADKAEANHKQFTILFEPFPSLLATGNEPLLLLREVARLGTATLQCHTNKLPSFLEITAEACFLSWTLHLQTERDEAAIREVFEFVEDECRLQIEEVLCPTRAGGNDKPIQEPSEQKKPPPTASQSPAPAAKEVASSIRVDIEKVDRLINMVGEIVITQAMLLMQSRSLPAQEYPDLVRGISELTQHTRELQEAVMAVRMQPVKSIFSRMPRIVRDLSAQLGKDIRLETKGEATEVDKTIIEQLSDPLTHMIRNSLDHGIEMPQQRLEKGKPAQGTITLSAEHRGGKIIITLSDDGQGINRVRVLQKAKEKGIIAPDAQLTEQEIDMLIFAAGFSTAETVTNVSGRGVGMDVVRRNIENLGGSVAVHNMPEKGSQFVISLPLTLAILDGMVVRVATEHYIIPIAHILETMRPKAEEIKTIADGSAVINVRGTFVPVLYLHQIFGIEGAMKDASKALIVLVENGNSIIGLVVDELVGQQQVVIKSLEENADPVAGVSGATILGDGKVSLILDIMGICQMKSRFTRPPSLSRIAEAA